MSRLDTLTERDIEHLADPAWRAILATGIDPRRLTLAMTRTDWPTLNNEPLPPDADLQRSLGMIRELMKTESESSDHE